MPDSARERYRRAKADSGWRMGDPRHSGRRTGHAAMFRVDQVVELGAFEDGGGFPKRFLPWAYGTLGVTDPLRVLHICSGSVRAPFTVDRRLAVRPAVVADARALPFGNETFEWAIADPPYSREWARTLYGIPARQYPTPGGIVREAMRVLRPGGRLGLLHYMVPPYGVDHVRLVGIWGITVGPGSTIRAWSVLEKRHPELRLLPDDDWPRTEVLRTGAPVHRDEARSASTIRDEVVTPTCAACGVAIESGGRGPKRAYCSDRCRARAMRRRRAGVRLDAPPGQGRRLDAEGER